MLPPTFAPGQFASQSLADHAGEIQTQGYTVIRNVLDKSDIESARSALDEILGREATQSITQGCRSQNYSVSYMLLQKHPRFRSIIMLQPVVDLMRMLLGDDCVLSSLNGISMTPGGDGQQLHRDSLGFVGHTATVNAVFTLDEFTRENGCTRLVPCSQNIDPSVLSNVETDALASLEQDALYIEAPVGSVIAYEGSLIHAGSPNRTNAPRRALHAFFTRALIKPQWDIPMSLSPEVVKGLTEEQKRLLGFYSRPRRYDYDRDETQGSTSSRALPPVIRQRARRLAKSLLQRMRNWQW